MSDLPYSSLFKVKKEKKEHKIEVDDEIPLKTLENKVENLNKTENIYDNYLIVFGTNLHALKEIDIIKKGEIIEQGRNWLKIYFESEDLNKECMKIDKVKIDDEIVGCYRNIENIEEEKEKKGIMKKLKEYFFGK